MARESHRRSSIGTADEDERGLVPPIDEEEGEGFEEVDALWLAEPTDTDEEFELDAPEDEDVDPVNPDEEDL